jgi:hypothetical protein
MTAFDHLLPRRRRHIIPEERTHFVTKRDFFLVESEIHRILL